MKSLLWFGGGCLWSFMERINAHLKCNPSMKFTLNFVAAADPTFTGNIKLF